MTCPPAPGPAARGAAPPPAEGRCEPASGPGWRLWHAQRAWARHLEAALAPLGLTHTQLLVLVAAGRLGREPPSQARLAEHVGIDRMTASRVLRLLETRGRVARAPHPADPRANGASRRWTPSSSGCSGSRASAPEGGHATWR